MLLAVAIAAAVAALDSTPEPRTRSFHLEYSATIKAVPAGARRVELWIPVARDDPYQKITNLRISASGHYQIATGPQGNSILHMAVERAPGQTIFVALSLDATRAEHLQSRLAGGPKLRREETPAQLAPFLQPDRLDALDEQIRARAREVALNANAHTDLEIARAIYNYVTATVKDDKTGTGQRGAETFIGYMRALTIPARFAIGFSLPPARGKGQISGYHSWAEFYAKGIGWVPVDASEAAKNPDKRQYFFGAHDENRIEFSKGRDVLLVPRQHGAALNSFVYPYAEIDSKPFAGTALTVTYHDIDESPEK